MYKKGFITIPVAIVLGVISLLGGAWFFTSEPTAAPAGQSTRHILPFTDATYDIGTSTAQYRDLFIGDVFFYDEILPDGATCANGEILKKTGANNWDCAADAGAGGGEANTASSLGTGLNLFDSKSGVDLRFNTLSAGSNITLSTTTNSNTIVIASTGGGGTGSNWGFDTTYSETVLTPTTTIPIWLKDTLYASSTSFFQGIINAGLDFNVDTDTFFIDAVNDRVVIGGITSTKTVNGVTKGSTLTTHITGGSQDYTWVSSVHSNTVGPVIAGARSRGSEASPTIVVDDDNLLDLVALGYDGTDYEEGAAIHMDVNGTPGNNDMPGMIRFLTTPDGSVTLAEHMRITEGGFIGIGTTSPLYKLSVEGDIYTLGNATTTGIFVADGEFRFQSNTKTQTITATSQILSTTTVLNISSASDIVMTATPLVATSTNGALIILRNVGDFVIDLQDNSVAGSGVYHGGTTCVVNPRDEVTMMFQSDADGSGNAGWVVISHPNLASSGDANVANVRNVSGSSISAGRVVYQTGWNVGQDRATIDLADADDPTKMPALGYTNSAIANGANGTITFAGVLKDVVDTSSYAIGDLLYVDTTAGEVINVYPSIDDVQLIGIVTRSSAANGRIGVTGAGRVNQNPWNAEFTNATTTSATTTNLYVSGATVLSGIVTILGETFTNFTTYVRSLFTAGTGINISSGSISSTLGTSIDAGEITAGAIDGDDINSNIAGRSLTLTSASPDILDADVELFTRIATAVLEDPTAADDALVQWKFPYAITITRISCSTDTGTVTIQIDERAEATPNTGGTDVMSSTLVCDNNTEATTSFANAGIVADVPLNLDIDAVASTPGIVRIHIDYTFND